MKQPLAYVHPDTKVADNVVIEPFVSIELHITLSVNPISIGLLSHRISMLEVEVLRLDESANE